MEGLFVTWLERKYYSINSVYKCNRKFSFIINVVIFLRTHNKYYNGQAVVIRYHCDTTIPNLHNLFSLSLTHLILSIPLRFRPLDRAGCTIIHYRAHGRVCACVRCPVKPYVPRAETMVICVQSFLLTAGESSTITRHTILRRSSGFHVTKNIYAQSLHGAVFFIHI